MKTEFANRICVIRVYSVSFALKIIKKFSPGILRFEITPLMSKWLAAGRQQCLYTRPAVCIGSSGTCTRPMWYRFYGIWLFRPFAVSELWNFRSHVLSLPGAKVPWVELSLPGTFAPWNFRSHARKSRGTFVPWNFRFLELSLPDYRWLELTLATVLRYPAACETYQFTFVSYCTRAQSWKKFHRRRGLKSRRDRKLQISNRAEDIMSAQSFWHFFFQNRSQVHSYVDYQKINASRTSDRISSLLKLI